MSTATASPRVSPPALGAVLVASVFHYAGPAFAVLLFVHVGPLGVAWLRLASAAVVLAAWRRPVAGPARRHPGRAPHHGGLGRRARRHERRLLPGPRPRSPRDRRQHRVRGRARAGGVRRPHPAQPHRPGPGRGRDRVADPGQPRGQRGRALLGGGERRRVRAVRDPGPPRRDDDRARAARRRARRCRPARRRGGDRCGGGAAVRDRAGAHGVRAPALAAVGRRGRRLARP